MAAAVFLVLKQIKVAKYETGGNMGKLSGMTIRDEANAIVAYAFRNGFLEDLHAGKHSDLLENKEYSRITQEEMKRLMIESSEKLEMLLFLRDRGPDVYEALISKEHRFYCGRWQTRSDGETKQFVLKELKSWVRIFQRSKPKRSKSKRMRRKEAPPSID